MDAVTRVQYVDFVRDSLGRWSGKIEIKIAGITDEHLLALLARMMTFVKEVEGEGKGD